MGQEEHIKLLCADVLARIRPTAEGRRRVKSVIERIIAQVAEQAQELGIEAKAISVGSTARNTWIRGEADIDIFLMFPVELTEDEFKAQGLALAQSIAHRYEARYAAHPYIHAYVLDAETGTEYEADLVPCYAVADLAALKSAVDRTPFHNRYVQGRIAGREDEVLLLKQFLKVLGIYGSELRRRGFAGYLCELLILHYSSFVELLRNAAQWQYGERIDLEGKGTYRGNGTEPLIVIDPVDPKRNVAAAVSAYSFSRLIDAAREFLAEPSTDFFTLYREEPMSAVEFMDIVRERGTQFVLVAFKTPAVVEDILFPQLRKAETSVNNLMKRYGFQVYRSDVYAEGDKAFLLFELLVWELPRIKKHIGPPVTSAYHATKFKEQYRASHRLFIEDGRYVVEVARKHTDAVSLLKTELRSCSLGKQLRESIDKGYDVLRTEEIEFTPGIGAFFGEYFRGI
ncbi:MAG: CCA tRNA nucleotidyltransferase [Candidatus Methanospirareceae archaeon]